MKEIKKRYHVDNAFFSAPLSFRSIELYQLCDLACSDDYEVGEHRQVCHEISYIVSGEGVFARNGIHYPVAPGMLFLVSHSDTHYIRSSKTNPLRYFCMAFAFHPLAEDSTDYSLIKEYLETLTNPIAIDVYNVHESFAMALSEMANPNPLSEELIAGYLSQILVFTYRSFQKQHLKHYYSSLKVDNTKPFVYKIINYIDTNLTSIRKLSDLSHRFGYSYEYMSKSFSDAMGITIQEYYNKCRFEKAGEWLRANADLSFVSERLGFGSVQSFCKAFKQYYKIPPGQYRKIHGKDALPIS